MVQIGETSAHLRSHTAVGRVQSTGRALGAKVVQADGHIVTSHWRSQSGERAQDLRTYAGGSTCRERGQNSLQNTGRILQLAEKEALIKP